MTSTQATDTINDLYIQAKMFRAFAVTLDKNPNDTKAAQMWHRMADNLFDAVNTYDTAVSTK